MAIQTSNFCRQPLLRVFSGHCSEHGDVDRTEVEQFDGSMQVRECKKCQWNALHLSSAGSEAHQQAMALVAAERLNSALIGSGITLRFAESTLDNYRVEGNQPAGRALGICKAYVEQFAEHYQAGRSLILTGNLGTGKTHLASGMVRAVITQHRASALIVSAAEIIRVFKSTMGRSTTYTDRDLLSELAGFDFLVIDEVGAQAGTPYELGLLHEVIDRRYQLVLPTVLVSNLPARDLSNYIGDRALDRMRQNGGLAVGFTWESMRATA